MVEGISKNFIGIIMNYCTVSTVDIKGDVGARGYKNCFVNAIDDKAEAKQMGYLINSSIILIVLYFWIA